jgi:hypothetical protein
MRRKMARKSPKNGAKIAEKWRENCRTIITLTPTLKRVIGRRVYQDSLHQNDIGRVDHGELVLGAEKRPRALNLNTCAQFS